MKGYNDNPAILRIREAMSEDATLTRRSAIIAEVGEDNLRRVEMKMRKQDVEASPIDLPMDVLQHFWGKGEPTTVFGRVHGTDGGTAMLSVGGAKLPLPFSSAALVVGSEVACTYLGGKLAVVQDRISKAVHLGPVPPQPSLEMTFQVLVGGAMIVGAPIKALSDSTLLAVLPGIAGAAWFAIYAYRQLRMRQRLVRLARYPEPA